MMLATPTITKWN